MPLHRLTITDFRNLKYVDIELGNRLNVFFGENGSGKTSILESIHTLSLARSFRSRKFKSIINNSASSFTVFSRIVTAANEELAVGVRRESNGDGLIRVNQRAVNSASQLAELMPVRVINSDSFSLLDGGPGERRSLLDWLMFHVEHDFHSVWKQYEKCLKQRNSVLRHDKIDPLLLDPWDAELIPLGVKLDSYRARAFEMIKDEFLLLVGELEGLPGDFDLRFHRGWEKDLDLGEYLAANRDRDFALGYTRQGPHRADIRVMVGQSVAVDLLSRGQQKSVVSALILAQGRVFSRYAGSSCVYLVDDLPAELDLAHRKQLCHWLSELCTQVCITGVEAEKILEAWPEEDDRKVFHVKHGTVEEVLQDQQFYIGSVSKDGE